MEYLKIFLQLVIGLLIIIFSIKESAYTMKIISTILSDEHAGFFILYIILIPFYWLIGFLFIILGMRNLSNLKKK